MRGVRWKVCVPGAAWRGDGQWAVASLELSLPRVVFLMSDQWHDNVLWYCFFRLAF